MVVSVGCDGGDFSRAETGTHLELVFLMFLFFLLVVTFASVVDQQTNHIAEFGQVKAAPAAATTTTTRNLYGANSLLVISDHRHVSKEQEE